MTVTNRPSVTQPLTMTTPTLSSNNSGSPLLSQSSMNPTASNNSGSPLLSRNSMNPTAMNYIPISSMSSSSSISNIDQHLRCHSAALLCTFSSSEHTITGHRPPSAIVAQQLPPINKYSGEELDKEGETFQDWIEQFEMIAQMCGWDNQAKLVNLTTRLRGQAYSFYRTRTPCQRSDYGMLKSQLKERFTPVRIQAVHSSLFHQQKQ